MHLWPVQKRVVHTWYSKAKAGKFQKLNPKKYIATVTLLHSLSRSPSAVFIDMLFMLEGEAFHLQ